MVYSSLIESEVILYMSWLVEHYNSIMVIAATIWFIYFIFLVADDMKGE